MIKDIIGGHFNELFNREEQLSNERLAICKVCPLYHKSFLGWVCNPDLWLNPQTGDTSYTEKPGYFKGCNCRLHAKTRKPEAHCPSGKW